MANCPANCQTTLLQYPPSACFDDLRFKTLERMGFYLCTTTLPDPITPETIEPLIEAGDIVFTKTWGNIVWDAPITEDIPFGDCYPARQKIMGRVLNADDKIAISNTSGSPAITDNYFDYDWIQDKIDKQALLNPMFVYCDGDVVIPRERNGVPVKMTILSYIDWIKSGTQGGSSTEFKRWSIRFSNDPFAFYTAKPEFNLNDLSIIV